MIKNYLNSYILRNHYYLEQPKTLSTKSPNSLLRTKRTNDKKSPLNKTNQKIAENNINYMHNNTENNLNEKTNNITYNNYDNYNTYKKSGRNSPKKVVYINKKNSTMNKNFELNVECPEELHFFYINIFQKGNKINFEKHNISNQ